MKKTTIVFSVLFFYQSSFGQDPKELLKESYIKCQKITNGYFEMAKSMKWMNDNDTNSLTTIKCNFEYLKADSIYPVSFNYEHIYNGQYYRNVLYTGNEYVKFSSKDSTAQIMPVVRWSKELLNNRHNDIFNFYTPFTNLDLSPLPKGSDYDDTTNKFYLISKDTINNFFCFHIQMIKLYKYDSTEILNKLSTKYEFWINAQDMIPVKYSYSSKILSAGDTLTEYFSYALTRYQLNHFQKSGMPQVKVSAIPAFCKVEEFVETKTQELLELNSFAADWTLTSVNNKLVSLHDFEGQFVLIDFFYMSCYPCLKALPVLQEFSRKYESKGLVVIGINPIDSSGNTIKHFLSKRGIDYRVLLDKKDVAKLYHVSAYPTMYLVDRKGKIIFSHLGFGNETKVILEKLITDNL